MGERHIVPGLLLVAILSTAVGLWPRSQATPAPSARQMAALKASYHAFIAELGADAERAVEAIREGEVLPLESPRQRRRAFETIESVSRDVRRTLLLLDPDGLARAWGGPGFRHDLPLDELRPGGMNEIASFTAVSLYTVLEVPSDRPGWRIVVGDSFATDALPIQVPFGLRSHPVRWSLAGAAAEPLAPALESAGVRELPPPDDLGGPWLRLRFEPAPELLHRPTLWIAAFAVAVALLLPLIRVERRLAAENRARPARLRRIGVQLGVLSVVSYGLYSWQRFEVSSGGAPVDLAGSLGGSLADWTAIFLGGAAFVICGLWTGAWWLRRSWLDFLRTVVLSALAVGLVAEVARSGALRGALSERAAGDLDTPTPEAVVSLVDATSEFVRSTDVAALGLGHPDHLADHQDLALELWRRSPLAGAETVSALAVLRNGRVSSVFSYGLPIDRETGTLVVDSARWPDSGMSFWQNQRSAAGEKEINASGHPWGVVRFWTIAVPRRSLWNSPAFGPEAPLELRLLRGGPNGSQNDESLTGNVLIAHLDGAGRPLVSPWREDWRLPAPSEAVEPSRRLRVDTPGGRASAWFHPSRTEGLWTVLLLLDPSPAERLWRVGIVSLRTLLPLLVVGIGLLLSSLSSAGLRSALLRGARRYSVRLTVVMALIAILPLTLLNGLLFRNLAERLQAEQQLAGRSALVSLEHVLTDFLLGLEAGFSMDAQLDDELLAWLAEVVDHEVNVYWRGAVYASSKPDLFTAGLIPKRIPGSVYSRLALLGHPIAARVQQVAGNVSYLELYAPVSLGEARPGESGLFVSVPLLAQQEAASRELDALRSRGLVIIAGLMLLLVVAGALLARGFTRPLMRMIDGAGRIAGGAVSLGFRPEETELRTLGQAIDGMAGRIASSRARVEAEKSLLEGVVDNITSGVVALDRESRVTMANRTATELLGVSVGSPFDDVGDELEPVGELVRQASDQIEHITVSLSEGAGQREWTVVWAPVPGREDPAALLVVEDVTDVLRAQRLELWAEMARLIAHEVKNPLTPIRLSAEHLRQVWQEAPDRLQDVFDHCTANILYQVEELSRIAGDFSSYSRIPDARPSQGDLVEAVREIVDGYRNPPPKGVSVELECKVQGAAARIHFDRRLVQRAVRNLLENALLASEGGGEVRVTVSRADDGDALAVIVDDRGRGVSDTDLNRMFEPYFSTSSGGTGLGLPIARRAVEEHGGTITAARRPGGGLSVRIVLPAGQETAEPSGGDDSR